MKNTCATCHQAGVANAPKIGDKRGVGAAHQGRPEALVQTAIKGKGAMPPKGGDASLTDDEVARAVVFMANQAGAKFKEKPAAAPAQQQAAASSASQPGAAADGKRGLRQGLLRLPRAGGRRRAEARRQGGVGTAHQARHGHARAVGDQGQGRDAAQGRQPVAHRRRDPRGRRVHGSQSK